MRKAPTTDQGGPTLRDATLALNELVALYLVDSWRWNRSNHVTIYLRNGDRSTMSLREAAEFAKGLVALDELERVSE